MAESKNMLSFDFGNSTLRAILCRFDGEKITSEVVLSESNEMIKIDEYFYWDLLRIFSFMKRSVEKAAHEVKLDSVGICTWGVDFMLFDEKNHMLSNALSYRNSIGAKIIEKQTEEEKKAIEDAKQALSDELAKADATVESLKEKTDALTERAMKLGEAVYKAAQAEQGATSAEDKKNEDGTVDADFSEKK